VRQSNHLHIGKSKNKFQFSEVPIIWFNSAKFDMNLLVKYLSVGKYHIISTLEKSDYYKWLKVET
jgi:hypothetical protein